ncbi:5-cytosine rRNA methyltransferase NSUN4 isoform 1-T1 [Aulostomus maculatus]
MALVLDARLLLRKVQDLRCLTPRRNRVKDKWAATRPKYPPTALALKYFDSTYSTQLGQLWPSVRAALLSEKKYGALLNNFSSDALLEDFEAQGCRDFITDTDAQPVVEQEPEKGLKDGSEVTGRQWSPLQLSSKIKCVVFPRGDITRFKPARPDMFNLLGYYLMDAACVLPCLALDIHEGHNVLDLCAAPGGKALTLFQTQRSGEIVLCLVQNLSCMVPVGSRASPPPQSSFICLYIAGFLCLNDASHSRTLRLRKVIQSYVPKQLLNDQNLRIMSFDGTKWGEIERNTFDRVLVDVPCTTDRHSLMEDDNNIFSRSRTRERQQLPQLQLKLLLAGIEAACPGGEVLYSTCTLSHIQNVAVVEQAIHLAQENHGIHLQVVDLRPLAQMFRKTFHFAPDLHLGEMVIPHLAANFGPIYMCKLRRLT